MSPEQAKWFAEHKPRPRARKGLRRIAVGDLNVAPLEHDVWNHKQLINTVSHTPIEIARLKAEGKFDKYIPENAPKIDPAFRNFDPDGYYHPTAAGLVVLSYNSAKVKAEDSPKKWTDLLDIKWKGKVSTGHPGFSGYVGTWVLSMKKLYGWQYFDKLEKNKPQIGRSINDTVTALNASERQVAAGSDGSTLFSASRGNPLAVVLDAEGLDDASMQAIARWTRLPETTFVFPPQDAASSYRLRMFSPQKEVPFAGHPSIGTAHAVLEAALAVPVDGLLVQDGIAGMLPLRVEGDGLMLADAVLLQALDGSRPLTHGERAALQASPLTLRQRRLADK